jgi:glutathione S-transferase
MQQDVVLYSFGDEDRSGKVRWLACELGLPVREERVAFRSHRKPPYRELNALGQIPTAVFAGQTLIESTAICHQIAEAFAEPKLWIAPGEQGRSDYLFWLAVFGETLEGRLVECMVSRLGLLGEEYFALHERSLRFKLRVVAERLPTEGYLAGSAFTVADILAGYSMRLAIQTELAPREVFEPYFGRLVARKAAQASRIFAGLGANREDRREDAPPRPSSA